VPAADDLLRFADAHGVAVLLHESGGWPARWAEPLRQRAIAQAMWELQHQRLLAKVLQALAPHRIEPLIFKGTALAYGLYPNPAQRQRGDTDLLIPDSARAMVDETLRTLGYERLAAAPGELVSYQATYALQAAGARHALDVHWKINNAHVLAELFTYDELRAQARPLARLAPGAWTVSPIHALLLACMHRCTHLQNPYYVDGQAHRTANRLIWLYDIHLLAQQLDAQGWQAFFDAAAAKGLREVCVDGLREAHLRLRTACPADALAPTGASRREAPARYLFGGAMRQQWMDFVALRGWQRRARFLRELFFPPASYMAAKYGGSHAPLPWLYLRRAAGGFTKRMRPQR
jgi:hypothetical protein